MVWYGMVRGLLALKKVMLNRPLFVHRSTEEFK